MTSSLQVASSVPNNEGWDSDGSLSWEDFFGSSPSADLVPTLLGMYDALVGRAPQGAVERAVSTPDTGTTPVTRPLSISSIASSSSSSSGTSSCSGGRRLGAAPKSSAYLASIESLDDSEDEASQRPRLQGSGGSQGSGDSGVCSPCSHISSPCPPPRPRYCGPHLSYMDRVVMEIVETEGVYVRDLQQVIQGYLEVWRAASDCPLTERQLADLFNNIEDIYNFNSGFLQELEQCGLDPVKVARSFVRNNSGFSIYTQYCTNYPRTVSVLTELMRQEATVRLFRERQSALQHTLPLGSYLLKPVQRILKYHLLLQNIVKHYVSEAEGYSDIVEALSAMTGIAHHINNMKRRHEHAVRVQEIQSLLYGWEGEDLTTFGELCAEGAFRMSGAKALRHAFLFDKMLLITKKKEEGILGYKTHIMCSNLMLIESVPGEPLSFHVIPFDNPRLQHTLQARNLEQKREWSLQLKRVILENYNAVIPSHARQLVMELGQNRTDDEIMADKNTPKRQHSAPEYLEKRKQEKDRRKSETGLRYRLRRSRKSDAGDMVAWNQRGRRASSSSRDRSQSREDPRSSSPAKIKDRFGSWRRKSEPGCYSSAAARDSKLSVCGGSQFYDSEVDPQQEDNLLSVAVSANTSSCEEGSRENVSVGLCADAPQQQPVNRECAERQKEEQKQLEDEDEAEAKTLEEIVGQLLMQNREFQKILKKQQRQVSLRHRGTSFANSVTNQDETTDDEDGVYETLAVSSSGGLQRVPQGGQSYRAHRHAHMRALRNEQRSITLPVMSLPQAEADNDHEYVTLMCHTNKELKNVSGYRQGQYNTTKNTCIKHDVSQQPVENTVNLQKEKPDRIRLLECSNKKEPKCGSQKYSHHKETTSHESVFTKSDNKADTVNRIIGTKDTSQPNSGFGNYDNLEHIWESVRQQQEEIQRLADDEELAGNLCRTQSFSCQDVEGHPRFCLPPSTSQASLNIPTLPAVWLKQQGAHLATPSKKSGSLPRSFQLNQEPSSSFRSRPFARDGRLCPDRPFTIASDKPPEINFEDIERYIEQSDPCNVRHRFPINGDTTEEDSMTEYTATPNQSLNELNVHPEYKIYRPSVSKASLKHVISSVSNKLAGIRASSETLDAESERERILQRERRASRLVYALARQYSKTLKQRIRTIMGEESEYYEETPCRPPSPSINPPSVPSPNLPIYKQGSSSLGARIAHSEYANPRQLYQNIQPKSRMEVRPGSVLSISSNFTSSSEGEKTSGFGGSVDAKTMPLGSPSLPTNIAPESLEDVHLSDDGSGDSYYERSFEAMECFQENEIFRDSAVFSDHEDTESNCVKYKADCDVDSNSKSVLPPRASKKSKIPPPVPAKPDTLRIKSAQHSVSNKSVNGVKLKTLEESSRYNKEEQHLVRGLEGISKSIRDRRRELELWKSGGMNTSHEDECDTSSQHSTASTVIEVSPTESEEGGTPRGWVKHVIEKLQGDPSDGSQTLGQYQ